MEIVFIKILTMHYDYALCKSIYRDCVIQIDKIKLFANLGVKLFQETGGLSRWHELINNEKKTSILFEREPKAWQKEPSTIWHALDPAISPDLGRK